MRLHRATLLAAGLLSLACADTPTTPPPTSMAAVSVDPSNIIVVAPDSRTLMVGAGNQHTCVVTGVLGLRCWGSNSLGQAPPFEGNDPPLIQVDAGTGDNTCVLRLDFAAECFGKNDLGQSPGTRVAEEWFFVQVDAGKDHACALRADGIIECWGGNPEEYAPPIIFANIGSFMQVGAGDQTTCGLRTDGKIECGGVPGVEPTFSVAPRRFVLMSVGKHFVCGIQGNRDHIACAGANGSGQAPASRVAGGGSKYVQVSAGELHACALRRDGVVECWGENIQGQAPATRTASSGWFTQVSAGAFHTCALRNDLVVECWGQNSSGQTNAPPLRQVFKFSGFRSQQIAHQGDWLNHVVLFSGGGNMNLKFSLGSNEGLGVIAAGYPKVAQVNCEAPEKLETGPSTTGSLSYSATDNAYTYAWSIPGALTRSCQQFILKLTDNTFHHVNFRFTGPPAAIISLGGGALNTPTGTNVPAAGVKLVDQFGHGIAMRDMTFAVIEGGGSVALSSVSTGDNGVVQVPIWTVGPPGPQKLRATVVAVAGTFTLDLVTNSVP